MQGRVSEFYPLSAAKQYRAVLKQGVSALRYLTGLGVRDRL